ncbi:MAG: hypothetical protein P8010_00625 [Desulfosarcinaceae bacterium]|jgi:hypothetical protein
MKWVVVITLVCISSWGSLASAGEADVIAVEKKMEGGRIYQFAVTVRHADTGWDHYADKWEVVDEKGAVLGTRVLLHPHVDEQPFTRSLLGVKIPAGVKKITVRAHDSVHAYGGKEITLELP